MTDLPVMTPGEAKAVLAAAPVTTKSLPSGASGINSWIPSRNLWAGGLAGIAAFLLLKLLGTVWPGFDSLVLALGLDPATVQGWLAAAIAGAIATYVPPSAADIIKNLNDAIVHLAQRDPASNVSYVLPPVTPPPGEAAVIVPPAKKD